MAKWQKVYLHRLSAEATTSRQNTILVDLPQKDYLSQILVKIYKLNPSYSTALLPVFHFVKKLEVVDGSDVLYSLTGTECQAIAYYRGRTNPSPHRCDWESTETWDEFFIRFNRFPGDTKYLINLSKLANPQLKITYDNTVTTVDGYTYTVKTDYPTVKYTVICDILRGTPPTNYTAKFISSRQIFTWAPSTTGTEYIDIPRTDPIFGIGVRMRYTAKLMSQHFARTRLNINNQEWIPFDIYYNEMEMLHAEWFEPFITVAGRIETYYQVRYDSALGEIKHWDMIDKTANLYHFFMEGLTGGWLRPHHALVSNGANATTGQVGTHFDAFGLFPHGMIYLPMSVVTDTPEETLDAPATANILLEMTTASTSASTTSSVVVDVVRDEGR